MTTPTAVDEGLVAKLAQHRALGHAPRSEHEWLVAHGRPHRYAAGDVATPKGQQTTTMLILFAGHVVIRGDRGAGAHKIFEWKPGDVGGAMPYSRGAVPPADAVAEEVSDVLMVGSEWFPEMIRECPVVTTALVHITIDRVRVFNASDLRDEKLVSLGRLAAGLAHELNNPASAAVRSSKLLLSSLNDAEEASRILAGARLSEEQFAAIDRAREMCETSASLAPRTPLERADREDALTDWLVDHSATQEYAVPLADTGVTPNALDLLARHVEGDALEAALGWISACCTVRVLAGEIERAAVRIHDLVGAVKGFSYMDHAPSAEPVDIRQGIADTLKMLGAKTRAKSVSVTLDLPDDLPRAHGVGVELNQVWMNLIDNALDAAPSGGHVAVVASRELDRVVVRVMDDGAGMTPQVRQHIFEPFFTTKGVGKGTGLGLDTAKRLLHRHDGEIDVESAAGRTVFEVRLPMAR
ncbi:MAG TPA: ATP-binding protein [Gemmatimonadaceae bacterium]|nr:ATP-binding protein [Gemmatimonadaceae bacterium]